MPLSENLLSTALKKEELPPIQRFRFESLLTEKYGRDGLRIYFMVNGTNTVRQIAAQTGMDEQKFLEILRFMAANGVIRIDATLLEGAGAPKPEAAAEAGARLAAAKAAPAPAPKPAASAGVPAPEGPKPAASASPPQLRSPVERKLFDKFGQKGVDVYRLMDMVSTPEEILKRMEIEEAKLIEILEFMQDERIIELEKPGAKPATLAPKPESKPKYEGPPTSAPVHEVPAPPVQKPEGPPKYAAQYAPPEPSAPQAVGAKARVSLPTKKDIGLFGKLKLEAELLRLFGQKGVHLLSLVDGSRTDIELAKETKYTITFVDQVLDFLVKDGKVELHPLTTDELRERYGEEGVSISNVYGRDGIFIYELIDKKATVKDIILFSGVEPKRGVEIFSFIHRILGIDIPLDRAALYKQLGVEE